MNYDYDIEGTVKLGSQEVDFVLGFIITSKGSISAREEHDTYGGEEPYLQQYVTYLDHFKVEELPDWAITWLDIFGMEFNGQQEIYDFIERTPGLGEQLETIINLFCEVSLAEDVEDSGEDTHAYSLFVR